VTLLPAAVIAAGIFTDFLGKWIASNFKTPYLKFLSIFFFVAAVSVGITSEKAYFFSESPVKLSRNFYGDNPFPESIEIAKFIESHTNENDTIAVLGSEPQIYFYSRRLSATGYIYVYSLMEDTPYSLTMQKEMIREVEASRPKFIVFAWIPSSWLVSPTSETFILTWADGFLLNNYTPVGVADIISPDVTVYKWYNDAKNYTIQSPKHLVVFERRT
jgi:hypothetical protein